MIIFQTELQDKIKESLTSVLPVAGIVLLLCFTIAPIPSSTLMAFLIGVVFVVVGMGLFTLGADSAMTPIGERTGAYITKSKKLWMVIAVSFILGVIVTISEPDLQVLASQVPTVPNMAMILSVAIGVGVFLVVALLRILFSIKLSHLLIGCYLIVFGLAAFVPADFWSVAFDSGGVTTGPMTVPVIMALGTGVAATRSDGRAGNDSFGLVALCSVGPILTVLILGLIFSPDGAFYEPSEIPMADTSRDLGTLFLGAFPHYLEEVGIALGSVILFFLLFNLIALKLKKKTFSHIMAGLLCTYVGLVLFLLGVNVGFMPVGNYLGQILADLPYKWVLIPIGMIIGYFIVQAEPAVHVLNRQVVEITSGAIPAKALSTSLSIGVAVSIGLAMLRVLTGLNIMYILVPGYLLALGLTFAVPQIFTNIAFDAGGVASGPMTATFLLPLAMGACEALGGNLTTDAFGLVAMVAMTPLITIQFLGLAYKKKIAGAGTAAPAAETLWTDDEIIELM
ncbi:MAG: DUF1538 domain-containing protein [Firmicutes bacterium]|nr:DUF1538 domain-containing protein [Bacillota bacterium]